MESVEKMVEEFVNEVNDLEDVLIAVGDGTDLSFESEAAFEHSVGEIMSSYSSILGAFIRVMNCWRALPRGTQKRVIDEFNSWKEDEDEA